MAFKEIITENPEQTKAFARKFAEQLKAGSVIALVGCLGSGKTTFTKGLASGLGVKNPDYVNSPTFVLIREYKGTLDLYHIDLYRLDKLADIGGLGLDEYFNAGGVVVIEWAQKAGELLPFEHIRVNIDIIDDNKRRIVIL